MKLLEKMLNHCRTKSPWIFHMNSGSCNGCDIELIASIAPRYDVEQIGVHQEASPRHADILCITGPVTYATVNALKTVYDQVPHPKAVVAIGSCSASCNVFAGSPTVVGPLNRHIPVDVFVPGCPPRPDAIIEAIVRAATLLGSPDRKPLTDEDMQNIEPCECLNKLGAVAAVEEGEPCK